MAFVRKKQDIFGLTLDDSIWRNHEKSLNHSNDLFEQMSSQNLTPKNVSPVRQELKKDNSCFQYGFPSLFELNKICSSRQSTISFNQMELTKKKKSILMQHKQCNSSLFQYDLLFNQKINKETSVTQSCPCCPPLNLLKTSREAQQQKDFIIDTNVSYLRPISIKHLPAKPSLDNKSVQPAVNHVNNDPILNKHTSGKPSKVNPDFVMVPLKDEPVDDESGKPDNVSIPRGKTSQPVNPLKNMNNGRSNVLIYKSTDEKLNKLNNFKSKSQPSTLTVEKVQSILEFYHSTSEDFKQDNDIYDSDDDKDFLDLIDFSNTSKVKLIKCAQCDKEFPNKNSIRKHVRNDHKFICKICNKVSYHVRQMQRHEEKVHGTFIMKKPKKRGSKQTKRKRNPLTIRNYFCCGQNFNNGKEFGIHKSTHKFTGKKDLPYRCEI